MVRSGLAHN